MQSLKFAQLVFGLQYFLTFFYSGMVIYILCHYMLKVYDVIFFILIYTEIKDKRLLESQMRL